MTFQLFKQISEGRAPRVFKWGEQYRDFVYVKDVVTANWKADSGDRWTVPWGLQISKVTHFGSRPASLLLGYYKNSEHPEGSPDYQVRFQLSLLFPQKH